MDSTLVASHGDAGAPRTSVVPHDAGRRYTAGTTLGQGGGGEVLAVHDRRIGREIALKRLSERTVGDAGLRARFLREARVQAQLEHPAIVPVYDLGFDAWFTMKRVRGATLADILEQLRAGSAEARERHTQRRLLSAFSSVCLAIDFVHSRGVVHRDLKPANVMLGDFGEVYVLDWGIAKVAGLSDADLAGEGTLHGALEAPSPGAESGPSTEPLLATQIGEVFGTLGYMPPEQLHGELDAIGPATDVWALGAILFELLACERYQPQQSLASALASLDEVVEPRPSVRAPARAIAPELDAICAHALAPEPRDRFASARALHDAIERFLDGDRDLERRREQARVHVARAHAAEVHAEHTRTLEGRTLAMQEVNRALALDPTSEEARGAMVRLIVEPPASLPASAQAEQRASTLEAVRAACRVGALGFLSMLLFLPVYAWMGIRDWSMVGVVLGLILASAGLSAWGARVPEHGPRVVEGVAIVGGVLIALLTRTFGPFIAAPVLAFGLTVGLVLNPAGAGLRGVGLVVGLALVAPLLLEVLGVIEPSYVFHDGSITVVPHLTDLAPMPTMVSLTLTNVVTIMLLGVYLTRLQTLLRAAQERLHVYSWNLRQFLPSLEQPARPPGR